MQLSKDSKRVGTLEHGFERVIEFLSQKRSAEMMRDVLEEGADSFEYRIKFYKRPKGPGFNIRVYCTARKFESTPINFIDLL
jgi:hypothetical protein